MRKLPIMLEPGAKMPVREHPTDAGLDIRAMKDGIVRAGQSVMFHTGVHIDLPEGTAGLFVSKSGLMMDHDITSTGLVDETYNGEIMVKLFNHGADDYNVHAGDKISQLVVIPVEYVTPVLVEHIESRGRGGNGFGSTGR